MQDEMDNMRNTETTIKGEDSLPAGPSRSIVGPNYAERVEAYLSGGRLRPLLWRKDAARIGNLRRTESGRRTQANLTAGNSQQTASGRLRGSEYNRGTGCGKTARPGLCRGRRVTAVPTVEAADDSRNPPHR